MEDVPQVAMEAANVDAPQISVGLTHWEEHPLGPEYGAQWAKASFVTRVEWRGPHALALACSAFPCALVAVDETWIVVAEQRALAVLCERYRFAVADWRRLAHAAGYTGSPWIIADGATWDAVEMLLIELAERRAVHRTQRRLLRAAHDLLGVETFTAISQLPTRTQLRAAIVQALSDDEQ